MNDLKQVDRTKAVQRTLVIALVLYLCARVVAPFVMSKGEVAGPSVLSSAVAMVMDRVLLHIPRNIFQRILNACDVRDQRLVIEMSYEIIMIVYCICLAAGIKTTMFLIKWAKTPLSVPAKG